MKLNVIYLEIVRFEPLNSLNDRIAVIGFGSAGSTITLILAKKGYKETIFESEEKIG
ncbi:MAG: glutamate synthase small chain [Clostridium butyricum]|nr:glutamate synthase small chain [Clostridium butyricum]